MTVANRTTLETLVRRSVEVYSTEYAVTFRIREMSGTERDQFEIAVVKQQTNGSGKVATGQVDPMYLRGRLLALTLIDEEGNRLYKDNEWKLLSDNIPASIQGKLFAAAQKLNGLDAAAVEDAVKNSESGQSAASTSDSPENSEKPLLNS